MLGKTITLDIESVNKTAQHQIFLMQLLLTKNTHLLNE